MTAKAIKTATQIHYLVLLKDRDGEEHPVVVTADSLSPGDVNATMIDRAVDIVMMGRRNLASRVIDYDRYRSDSQYADDLDRLARSYELLEVRKDGPRSRFSVDALYGDGTGPWSEEVEAVDVDEAEFQAAWTMNLNCAAKPNNDGFLESLAEHTIHYAVPTPVSVEEIAAAVTAMIGLYRAGAPIAESLDALETLIAGIGGRVPAALATAA